MDLTLALGIIGALAGGAIAAAISSATSVWSARAARRDRASEALWEYHRALSGFASRLFHNSGLFDESISLADATFDQLREAYGLAYPWSGYLRPKPRRKFFRDAWLPVAPPPQGWEDDIEMAEKINAMAAELEDELERRFPLTVWPWEIRSLERDRRRAK